MISFLKKADRTLLEMYTGILFTGLVCQLAGLFLAGEQVRYAGSLWLGIFAAILSSGHMSRTLTKALREPSSAQKIIVAGYMLRYTAIVILMAAAAVSGILNPLIVFMGYMSLKVTAYLQPLTHKLYNKLFHETDPVGQPLPEGKDELQAFKN